MRGPMPGPGAPANDWVPIGASASSAGKVVGTAFVIPGIRKGPGTKPRPFALPRPKDQKLPRTVRP
ncbi:hypothetical protein GCM10011411_27700 [Aurantiacibacter arachoides]|nr:hypothetical protein GCM10011411_27700 [Aurantiacibacter arachoides]